MTTTEQPAPGWWLASDGNWYPPELAPQPEPDAPKKRRRWPLVVVGVVAFFVIVSAIGAFFGESPGEPVATTDAPTTDAFASTDTWNAVGGSRYLAENPPPGCEPGQCTPRPTADQAAAIESAVAGIYPGVLEGKASDWAISVCDDIRRGLPAESLLRNATMRYSGGHRPDPTHDQAQQIIDVVQSGGWCSAA